MERRLFLSKFLAAGGLTALDAASGISLSDFTQEPDLRRITQVLVTFKCHLDVGFDNTQAAIMRLYFDQYFPKAIAIAEEMARSGAAQARRRCARGGPSGLARPSLYLAERVAGSNHDRRLPGLLQDPRPPVRTQNHGCKN